MDINTDTPAVETSTNESAIETSVSSQVNTDQSLAQPVVEEFSPNYKYKAYGKEFEMDEWARPLLNKDTQPHLTKLFEKAGGFEPLKERYSQVEQEVGKYKTAYSALDGARNQIVQDIQKGNLGNVFKTLGLNDQQIREFVKQQLTYESLPDHERRRIDNENHIRQQAELYQQQLQQQQEYSQSLAMQKHELELQTTFANPKFANLISSYNQRMGNEEAFRDAVDKVGNYEWTINGRSITPAEAVEGAIRMLGLQAESLNPGMGNGAPVGGQGLPQSKPQPKPIIVPNGSSGSPVKKRPMSIADLENEYKQLTN
jgi:hypothetical protein